MFTRLGMLATGIVLATACARGARAEDLLAAQDRRDYEALKVRRERVVAELTTLWESLDAPSSEGGGRATRLARVTSRELEAELLEAELAALLHRARELRRALLESESRGTAETGSFAGRWRITFGAAAGELDLSQSGAFLSGSWTLDGASGGTFLGHGGGRAVLMLLDDRGDLYATVKASASGGVMTGTYLRSDLASGEPAQGAFSATRSGR